jgi:hypothetical protein
MRNFHRHLPWLSGRFGLTAMAVLLRTGEPLVEITAGR